MNNTNAVAMLMLKPRKPVRPPRPANARLKSSADVPGAPISNATAAMWSWRPVTARLKPKDIMPGAPFPIAVATARLKPIAGVRPPRPARLMVKPKTGLPGAPFASEPRDA